jgi:hypothetical protein
MGLLLAAALGNPIKRAQMRLQVLAFASNPILDSVANQVRETVDSRSETYTNLLRIDKTTPPLLRSLPLSLKVAGCDRWYLPMPLPSHQRHLAC